MTTVTAEGTGRLELIQPGQTVEQYGLRQSWTVLAVHLIRNRGSERDQAVMLAVRPHGIHPFVVEYVAFQDGYLIAWQGGYHPNLPDAMADLNDRIGRAEGVAL